MLAVLKIATGDPPSLRFELLEVDVHQMIESLRVQLRFAWERAISNHHAYIAFLFALHAYAVRGQHRPAAVEESVNELKQLVLIYGAAA